MKKNKIKKSLHPDVVRLQELEVLEYDDEITDDEFDELERLRYSRKEAQVLLIPRPTCCKAIQEYPAIHFEIEYMNNEGKNSSEAPGNWTVSIPEMYYNRMHRDISWFKNKPNPKFCPFCGTVLPKMKRKFPLPPNVSVISYDGDYCNTCGERCMNCKCDPPEAIWEEE